MSIVYLGLGSNMGDRAANLKAAIESFAPAIRVTSQSSLYETPPWGYTDQPAFLNMVVKAETELEPLALLHFLKELEERLGRLKNFRYGPRSIDLDILFYDELVLREPGLVIPHARLHQRGFVLVPLQELAPDLVHPVLIKSVSEMLQEVDTQDIHKFTV
jgi:2-amino-4-hydroxy-6-hydroxymethyldihydropteridine diphosphokinase